MSYRSHILCSGLSNLLSEGFLPPSVPTPHLLPSIPPYPTSHSRLSPSSSVILNPTSSSCYWRIDEDRFLLELWDKPRVGISSQKTKIVEKFCFKESIHGGTEICSHRKRAKEDAFHLSPCLLHLIQWDAFTRRCRRMADGELAVPVRESNFCCEGDTSVTRNNRLPASLASPQLRGR